MNASVWGIYSFLALCSILHPIYFNNQCARTDCSVPMYQTPLNHIIFCLKHKISDIAIPIKHSKWVLRIDVSVDKRIVIERCQCLPTLEHGRKSIVNETKLERLWLNTVPVLGKEYWNKKWTNPSASGYVCEYPHRNVDTHTHGHMHKYRISGELTNKWWYFYAFSDLSQIYFLLPTPSAITADLSLASNIAITIDLQLQFPSHVENTTPHFDHAVINGVLWCELNISHNCVFVTSHLIVFMSR